MTGKMDVTMAINGAIAGLVGITAGPSAPSGGAAVLIGLLAGLLVYVSILYFEKKLKIDDPVGAISAHGIVGIFGVMVVPFTLMVMQVSCGNYMELLLLLDLHMLQAL